MKRWFAFFVLIAIPLRAEVNITPVATASGLEAWLVEESSIPFVSLELIFEGGAVLDNDMHAGATNLMTALLSEGAGEMDAQAFASRAEELTTRLRFEAGRDTITISARFLTEDAEAAIDLLRLALTEPLFDESAIQRVRERTLAQLRRDALNPNKIASQAFARAAFGHHPYGRESNGTPETVAALDRETLISAHRGAIARDRAFIGAAGDISAADLGQLLDRLFDGIPDTGSDLVGRAEFLSALGIEIIPFEGPQSVVAFGHAGIPRDAPDFMAAFVANSIFGSGRFGSRLMQSMRSERGLTYGIATYLFSGAFGDSHQGRLSADNGNVEVVMEILQEEWTQMAESGVTKEELQLAKTYLTGAYPLRFDGNSSIASIMASMQYQGFDIDYVNTRNDMITALTLDEVNAVAARLFDPESLFFVIVGQPDGLD